MNDQRTPQTGRSGSDLPFSNYPPGRDLAQTHRRRLRLRWLPILIAWTIALGFQNTALAQPTPITINGPDTVCLSSTSNYYVAPTTGIAYSWTVSAPNTVMSTTATGATVLWNALGAPTLTVTGKDASGTVQELGVMTVHVFPNPTPTIFTSYRVGCNALSEQDSVGETHATKYFILDDANGCVKVCDSSVVIYHANGDTTGTILWSVTGGVILSGQGTTTLAVQWGAAPAAGSISLTETSLAGCTGTKTVCIDIIEKPNAAFCILPRLSAVDSEVVCVNSPLVFKDISTASPSSPIVGWLWNFGDGTATSSLHPNVAHTYATPGVYKAYLVVTNQCGCTDTFLTKINVLPDQGPDIFCPSVVCENDTATYHTNAVCKTYKWSVSGGTIVGATTKNNLVVRWDNVDSTGYGYVSLSTGCGRCHGTTTLKVPVVQSNPMVKGPTIMCTNEPYQLSIPLWPATQYSWGVIGDPSAVIAGRNSNVVGLQFSAPGSYIVHVSYQNKLKLCGGDLQINVTVTDPPEFIGDTVACKDATASHNYTLNTGASASWTLASPNGTYSYGTGTSFSTVFSSSGTYTLSATVPGSCSPDPLTIVVNDNPIGVDLITGATSVCHDLPYVYTTGIPISGTHFEWSVTPNSVALANGYSYTMTPPTGNQTNIQFTTGGTKPVAGSYWTVHVKRVSNTLPYCEGRDTSIIVYPIIVAPNITGATSVCANSYENYSANWPGAASYSWQIIPNTAGSVVTGNNANNMTVLWNNTISTTNAMIIVTVHQCNDVGIDTLYPVSIGPAPLVALAVSPNPICGGGMATLTATSGAASYTFDFGDGSTPFTTASNSTTHVYTNPTTVSSYTAKVTASGSTGGCAPTGSASVTFTVNPAPYASITASGPTTVCIPNPINLTLTAVGSGGSGGTLSYSWTKNGSPFTTSPPTTVTCVGSGSAGTYIVTVSDGSCSTASAPVVVSSVTCTTPCTPSGSVSITSLSQSCGSMSGTASGSGGGVSPQWTVNGNIVSTTSSFTASYPTPGTYQVEYSEDFAGCRAFDTRFIDVPVLPDIKAQWQCPTGGATNYTLNLIDNSQYITSYTLSESWTVTLTTPPFTSYSGSGSPYSLALPPGTYTVALTVTASNGTVTDACSTSTTVTAPTPISSVTIQDSIAGGSSVTNICEGVPVHFYIATTPAGAGISSTAWNFGDGAMNNVYPTQRTFTFTGSSAPLPRSVSVTFVDAAGCPYSPTAFNINVYPKTLDGHVSGPSVSCAGSPVTLNFTLTGVGYAPYTYLWSTGATASSASVSVTGAYHVTVTDNLQCQKTTNDYGVSFITLSTPQITGRTDYCVGDAVRLSASIGTDPSYSYQWYRNGTPIATGPGIADLGLTAGSYNYHVDVTYTDPVSSITCTQSSSVFSVTVHGTPAPPVITGPVALDCSLYQLQLSASHPSGATQYFNWSNGASGQYDTIYAGGPYRLWYTDPYGCVSYTTVSVPPSPESWFDWFPSGCYDVCNTQLPLTIYGPPYIFPSWAWLLSGSTLSSGTYSMMDPLAITGPGDYSATVDNGLCAKTTDGVQVNVVNCDNCPPLILNGNVMCDPAVPGGYIVNLNLNVAYANTSCTIGTGIGPAVPFSAFFSTPGAYPLMLNFTTLSIPPPATATIMVRYYVTNHGVTQECYDTLQLALPDCSGQWPPQRQSQSNTQAGSADGMMVYPNPASHTVGVSYNFGTAASGDAARRIAVYDMMGRSVYTQKVDDAVGNITIPVDKLAAAVYIVRMEENGRTIHAQRLSITH